VIVESNKPLKGFAKDLIFDSHKSIGGDLYRYDISDEGIEKALQRGGTIKSHKSTSKEAAWQK